MAIAPERIGIGIRRHFTTAGVHPYDEIAWERRDARITNFRDGSVAFEQRDVEVPVFWSQNATNILAQKYFRGQLGLPERESSLRQVADRVADTIADWGIKDGYFVDQTEAEIFRDELKYLIVHQRAAFNSPVWFNIGVAGVPQQGSACFILAVEDTMDAILDWYKEEGTIFKGGSGSGINLSNIRSSKEHLKGGGTASGPVSFMRGADASAGTIKSGGKTRRAAKMVILNADHPDIEDFIWCKTIEERKARALRDAGFDMDLDGKDSHSIQYQNANNSVRVTDEFMQAVIDDGDWHLRAVTTGAVLETVKARDLFRQIAKAAWECADPGMQFDTTINKWHTAANTGRINGSNPCSEYVHLDNSACNLASINLLRFLDDEDHFDVEGYKAAIEVMFTAQEILVGNGDYPTPKIEATTRRFRQLGLGYANLGAVLMALGLPYDSDEGRAYAAVLTALLTGHAYATSARTAMRMGPFGGYTDNREHMNRVLRMHRDAVASINEELVPTDLLSAAQESWDAAVELGEVHGVRNSQATVLAPTGTISFLLDCDTTGIEPDLGLVKSKKLVGGGNMKIVNQTIPRALRQLGYAEAEVTRLIAYIDEHDSIVGCPDLRPEHLPVFACSMGDNTIHYSGHVRMMGAVQPFISGAISKCIVGDSLVPTADGLIRIGSLHDGERPDSFRDEIIEVASIEGTQKTDAFYYGGVRSVREVRLRSGHGITGTLNHRLLVAGDGGRMGWKRLDEIEPGDAVAVRYGADLWSPLPAFLGDFVARPPYGSQKKVRLPVEMTTELAFLLGAFASEGHIERSVYTIKITNSVPAVLERVAAAWRTVFGADAPIVHNGDRCAEVHFSSKTVVEFFDWLGTGGRASEKRIPDVVMRSTREHVLAFLQGLALDAYVSAVSMPKWAICLDSPRLLDDLQSVLTNLGVVHGRISKYNRDRDKSYDEVYATGADAQRLCGLVPFIEPDKAERMAALQAIATGQSTADVIPGLAGRELHALIPRSKSGRNGTRVRTPFSYLLDPRTKAVSRRLLERVAAVPGVELPPHLSAILRDNLHFSPVVAVADAGEREVFDVSVPTTHAFVANGIVNHNTVNLPEEATIEDVEQLHIDAWRLGLKAVAMYRDNCKVAQPLSTARRDGEATSEPEAHDDELAVKVALLEEALQRQTVVVKQPLREHLPRKRRSSTSKFRVADCEGYFTIGEYDDGRPGELFINVSKQGSTLAGIMDAFAVAISVSLQHGVPLATFVRKYTNTRFEPAGMTDDPDLRIASSLVDYIFRRLAVDYLPFEERAELGIMTVGERTQPTLPGIEESTTQSSHVVETPALPEPMREQVVDLRSPGAGVASAAVVGPVAGVGSAAGVGPVAKDAPYCYQCGNAMQRAGSCFVCTSCGTTSGCS